MKNFFEWCRDKGLSLEAVHKEPVRAGKKCKGEKGDSGKYSGTVHKMYKDLSKDYVGMMSTNGTVEPFSTQGKGGGTGTCKTAIADVAK